MSLKNKVIMVTGGAGFIGSHVVDALLKEDPEEVIVVDIYTNGLNNNLEHAFVDSRLSGNDMLHVAPVDACSMLEMRKFFEMVQPDIVFNLAISPLPKSLVYPNIAFLENVDITLNLCELARNNMFKTLIHFSSSEVYGTNISDNTPMNEDHPLNGTTPYAASKIASDALVLSYARTFGINTSIIRPFNNYGPRQNDKSYAGVIPLTIKGILTGGRPFITGDGNQTRDFLYVTDTAHAAIEIYKTTATRGKVLNIASGVESSINTVVKTICDNMEYDTDGIDYIPQRPGDVRRHIANIYRAEDMIGFKPTVSFEDGIIQTINWYKRRYSCKSV